MSILWNVTMSNPIWPDVQVNEVSSDGFLLVGEPHILAFTDGKLLVTWVDCRNKPSDVYGQFYDASGQPIGANIQISDDSSNAGQLMIQAAQSQEGTTLIVWQDLRNSLDEKQMQIFGQFFVGNTKKGTNFRIDPDTSAYCQRSSPQVYAMPNGKFLVLWQAQTTPENCVELLSRIINEDGIPEKTYKIILSKKTNRLFVFNADIDSLGKSTLFWVDSNEINLTQLDLNLNTITQQRIVFTLKPDMQYVYLSLVKDPDHGLLLTWRDNRFTSDNLRVNSCIYARWLSFDGTPISDEFPIMADSMTNTGFLDPRVMLNPKGEMVFIWRQYNTSSPSTCSYHLQIFSNDMKKIGSPKVIPINFQEGSVQMMGNRAWVAWTQDAETLMRSAWSIEELLPALQRNVTMHQVPNFSNFHFNKNGTNLKLRFNASASGTGQLNIVQIDGNVIYRHPVIISKTGSQLVNIPMNRKQFPFSTYVLQFQIAGRNYINKFLTIR
jgi:hypothetical protein